MRQTPDKKLIPWLDNWQLITKITEDGTKDGGDTCANEYTRMYALRNVGRENVLDEQFVNSALLVQGIPRRHVDAAKWYSGINRTSRDQFTPYLCWLLACSRTSSYPGLLQATAAQHAKNGFIFAWNTRRNFQYPTLQEHSLKSTSDVAWNYSWKLPDFTGPDIWSLYLRCLLYYKPLLSLLIVPLLHILDLFLLFNALYSIKRHVKAPDYDRRNLTLKLHSAARHWPSLCSKLAWYLYKRSRVGQESAKKWFTQPGEPPIHLYLLELFK